MTVFGKTLMQELNRRKWTKRKLALRSGISADMISKYTREDNGVQPTAPNMCAIADALGVSLDYLCGRVST